MAGWPSLSTRDPLTRPDPLPVRDSLPHHLPAQPTTFVGRERELAAVTGRLGRPEVRLLGTVGVGRGPLAIALGEPSTWWG